MTVFHYCLNKQKIWQSDGGGAISGAFFTSMFAIGRGCVAILQWDGAARQTLRQGSRFVTLRVSRLKGIQ